MRFHKTLTVFLITNSIFRSVTSIFALYNTYVQGIVRCKPCGQNDLILVTGDAWSIRKVQVSNCNQNFILFQKYRSYQANQVFLEVQYQCPDKSRVTKKLYPNCPYKWYFSSYVCDYIVIDIGYD